MPTVRREVVLPVSRERAWELLTDVAELARWLADDVELEAEPGGRVRARWADGRARTGVVDAVEHGERIEFRWRDEGSAAGASDRRPDADPEAGDDESAVEWHLDEVVDGTRLVVLERRLGAGPIAAAGGAWEPRLSALASLAVAVLA